MLSTDVSDLFEVMDRDERLTLSVEPFGAYEGGRWSHVAATIADDATGELLCESSWPSGEYRRIVLWASLNGFEFADRTAVALMEHVVSTCLVTGDGTVSDAVSSFLSGL